MKCWMILCGFCVLLSLLITGGSAVTVDISPDVLYANMPVTITYSGLQDENWIGTAFRLTYVPETPEFSGIIAELFMPFNLSDFYTVSIDGNYTFDSFDFFSDSYAVNSLSKGIFYFDPSKRTQHRENRLLSLIFLTDSRRVEMRAGSSPSILILTPVRVF